MFRTALLAIALIAPAIAHAQAGLTQDRNGLDSGSGSQGNQPSNSLPSGGINARTGPQSRPAYSSGASTTPNPGDAFVRNTPKPAGGQAQKPPGTLNTVRTGPNGTSTPVGGPGVGAAARPPQ